MSKRLLLLLALIVVAGFIYMHFEWFPAHTGPNQAAAQARVMEWARAASGQDLPHVRVERVNVPDRTGVATAEVAFDRFYFETGPGGQHYSGKGRVDFVRTGGMFRPDWTISRVTLVDKEPRIELAVARAPRS